MTHINRTGNAGMDMPEYRPKQPKQKETVPETKPYENGSIERGFKAQEAMAKAAIGINKPQAYTFDPEKVASDVRIFQEKYNQAAEFAREYAAGLTSQGQDKKTSAQKASTVAAELMSA